MAFFKYNPFLRSLYTNSWPNSGTTSSQTDSASSFSPTKFDWVSSLSKYYIFTFILENQVAKHKLWIIKANPGPKKLKCCTDVQILPEQIWKTDSVFSLYSKLFKSKAPCIHFCYSLQITCSLHTTLYIFKAGNDLWGKMPTVKALWCYLWACCWFLKKAIGKNSLGNEIQHFFLKAS